MKLDDYLPFVFLAGIFLFLVIWHHFTDSTPDYYQKADGCWYFEERTSGYKKPTIINERAFVIDRKHVCGEFPDEMLEN